MRLDRLQQIADHLRNGQLAHRVFDYNEINSGGNAHSGDVCGTHGCAIGEFPAIWPEVFKWHWMAVKFIDNEKNAGLTIDRAADWLEMSEDDVSYLFYPGGDNPLPNHATKEQVADHIQQFIKKHQ